MAIGPYNVGEHTHDHGVAGGMDEWLKAYNGTFAGSQFKNTFTGWVNSQYFGSNPILERPYDIETGTGLQTIPSGTSLMVETATGAVSLATNHQSDLIAIQSPGNVNLTDQGSSGDSGDFVVDTNNADSITVVHGNNTVFGGSGYDTLHGGAGTDILIGGGHSWVVAGTGAHQILAGGVVGGAHDTLIGGGGADLLKVFTGDNSLQGGSGMNTLYGGAGDDTLMGGGTSREYAGTGSQHLIGGTAAGGHDTLFGSTQHGAGPETMTTSFGTNLLIAGTGSSSINSGGDDAIVLVRGTAVVTTTGTNTDTIYFGGHSGDDTIHGGMGDDNILVQGTEHITKISSSGNATTLTFQDNQTLTYTGSHVTVTFNGF